jgi:serine/threonine protein kinase
MKTTHCPYCGQAHPEDTESCPVTGKPLTSSFLQIGKIVGGKYELLKLLGEGGIGFVYEARNVEIRNLVALKLVHGPLASTAEIRQRFIREAIAAAEIGHENIINVFDKGVDQATGAIYIVMELLKGETLADRIKRDGMMSVPEASDILLQALSALKSAHDKGIVHRNLKPENVFLTKIAGRKDFVKILDFGVALIREPAEGKTYLESEAILGTPHYLAPEQIGGTGKLDLRVDVYACGAMLYEAVVGQVPFDAPSLHAVIYRIINELPPGPRSINSRLSKDFEKIILTAMKKDPAERYPTAEAFGRALEPFGTGRIEFDRYTFLPPKREQAVPDAACPEPPVPAQSAQAAKKPPRKGFPLFVILLMVGLPLVSILALIALVVLNVYYFKSDSESSKDEVVAVHAGADAGEQDAEEGPDAQGDPEADPACAGADAVPEPVEEEVAAGRRLEIVTDPPGAEIVINGLAVGTSPLEFETTEQQVDLEANLEGYELFKTSYEVKSDSTHVEIKLVPVPEEKKKKKKKKCDPRDPKCRVGGR